MSNVLLDVLRPQKPPKEREPAIVHTLEFGILTVEQLRQKKDKAECNERNYLKRKGRA